MKDKITNEQLDFYNHNRQELMDQYLSDFSLHIDPDAVRDRFAPIGYNRSNVQKFQEICKLLTKDIFYEALNRNKDKVRKVIFAAGLPASGKTSHLKKMNQNELIYDGTINDEEKFIELIRIALAMDYIVEVFVYTVDPKRAFESNLNRGDNIGRYVPISHYEKVAKSINRKQELLEKHFKGHVKFRNFEHTNFEGKQKNFSSIIINRSELERIANGHKFPKGKTLQKLLSNNSRTLLKDKKAVAELLNLKDLLVKIENNLIEERSVAASKALSQMSEEERSMLSMTPDEKKFFLKYKAKNPKNPWAYFKEYQSKLQKEYNAGSVK